MKVYISNPPIKIEQVFDCKIDEVWNVISEETALKEWFVECSDYTFGEGYEFVISLGKQSLSRFLCHFTFIDEKSTIEYTIEPLENRRNDAVALIRWELHEEHGRTILRFAFDGIDQLVRSCKNIDYKFLSTKFSSLIKSQLSEYLYKKLSLFSALYD